MSNLRIGELRIPVISNGLVRRVFDDCVVWIPEEIFCDRRVTQWDYTVQKIPFVSGFHVCIVQGDEDMVLSTHKTLHEAMGVCKVLLANGGVRYV